ncbi:Uncharacterised protein [Mycobacterium tuberculosis]|nr:Uncharacterised protein [Mycobacterium tuberculosis]CML44215.1 Uncharacterised protein [Mycobacterium tuberculosis]
MPGRFTAGLDLPSPSTARVPNLFPTRSLAMRMFPKVFPPMKTAPGVSSEGHFAGSGDRIRTCDLWVMS